jgi:hypothetical protein
MKTFGNMGLGRYQEVMPQDRGPRQTLEDLYPFWLFAHSRYPRTYIESRTLCFQVAEGIQHSV